CANGGYFSGCRFRHSPLAWKATKRMSACPSCGSVAKPTDKFCNTCGTPVARPSAGGQQAAYGAAPAPQAYGAPQGGAPPAAQGGPAFGAPPQGYGAPAPGFGGPQASRCGMGHEIASGASYCAQGHPIALDAMQFA